MVARALALFVLLVVATAPAAARDAELLLRPTVGGQELSCRDFRGKPVRTYVMASLGDVARASYVNRMPIIFLDQHRLETLPDKLKIFFYEHECAHHVLGHYFYRTTESENDADCWAIHSGRGRGYFNRDDVVAFAPHFAQSRGSPMGHLPGPERAVRLVTCFDTPPGDGRIITAPGASAGADR